MEIGNFMQDMSGQGQSLSSDYFPKITLKQAEEAVKKNSFKISRPQYSKKRVKKQINLNISIIFVMKMFGILTILLPALFYQDLCI